MTDPTMDLAARVEALDDEQKAFLLRYEPTLADQPIAEADFFDRSFDLFIEDRPQAFDPECGILIDPGERQWFASMNAQSSAGSSAWDKCTMRYNSFGIALAAALRARTEAKS